MTENKATTVYLDGETSGKLKELVSGTRRSKSNFVSWLVNLMYEGRVQITDAGRAALEETKEQGDH